MSYDKIGKYTIKVDEYSNCNKDFFSTFNIEYQIADNVKQICPLINTDYYALTNVKINKEGITTTLTSLTNEEKVKWLDEYVERAKTLPTDYFRLVPVKKQEAQEAKNHTAPIGLMIFLVFTIFLILTLWK